MFMGVYVHICVLLGICAEVCKCDREREREREREGEGEETACDQVRISLCIQIVCV